MFDPAQGLVASPTDQADEPESSALPEPEEIVEAASEPDADPGMEFLVWPA